MYSCNGMMGDWGWISGLFSLLVLALIIGGVILLVRHTTGGKPAPQATSADAILAERYARGEIDEQDYQQRMAALHGKQPQQDGPERKRGGSR